MDPKHVVDEEPEHGTGAVSLAMSSMAETMRPLLSKQARKAYLGTLLFILTAISMVFISALAYAIFYYNFIPQVGLERIVHMQFDDGHPWGVASLGSDLVSLQMYDVQVELELPRTPSNVAAGNFMLDLALYSPPSASAETGSNTSTTLLSQSRRSAILTYASPLVDTANKLVLMPFYVLGWNREAEKLRVGMLEKVQFPRGQRKVPSSLRLEIHSAEKMQVYRARVMFKATFTGLRWIMYNWKLTSFVIFGFMFWSVSMVTAGMVWALLAIVFHHPKEEGKDVVKTESGSEAVVKSEDTDEPPSLFDVPSEISHIRGTPIKQEEDLDDGGSDSIEDTDGDRGAESSDVSGTGTGLESAHARGIQRRRSHLIRAHS
ncbi:adipose-regulatory protein [Aspergillus uvarum CBS 121591]|uniref:Adipose-regulatory protein n=1 Tax=Aspergillus uvarum CBS 121591 TaxID=1448315 RepID=A0A319C4P2_9EURO|nr:adipose-regulatory protein [Aspergillus uvarum CBS 121591]PYH78967.1 adipose-regulatory protein [Aspergillus uvarum CBS 121591]